MDIVSQSYFTRRLILFCGCAARMAKVGGTASWKQMILEGEKSQMDIAQTITVWKCQLHRHVNSKMQNAEKCCSLLKI